MATSVAGLFLGPAQSGQGLAYGQDEATLLQLLFSTDADVTAAAGGGQAAATPLTAAINVVATVGAAAASVMLPPALPGLQVQVINGQATNSMQVFGQATNANTGVGDTIIPHGAAAAAATAVGVPHAASLAGEYTCVSPGVWKQSLSS